MSFIAQQSYKIDLTPHGGYVVVYASQHDNEARSIVFRIYNQGKVFDIPANINVSVQGVKSNGGYFTHNCTYSGNLVTMPIDDDMTDVVGKAICVLKFTNASQQKLATAKFILNVDSDSSSEGIIIDTEVEAIFNQMLDEIRAQAASVNAEIAELQSMVGSPLVASTVSAMTNHNKIYVYTGSESGYTNGNWYYWNGSAWTSGGVYNSVAVNMDSTPTQGSTNAVSSGGVYDALHDTDTTLSQSGQAADAKETGNKITSLKEEINDLDIHVFGVPNYIKNKNFSRTDFSLIDDNTACVSDYIPIVQGSDYYRFEGGVARDIYTIIFYNSEHEYTHWFGLNGGAASTNRAISASQIRETDAFVRFSYNKELGGLCERSVDGAYQPVYQPSVSDGIDNRIDGIDNRIDGIDNRIDGVYEALHDTDTTLTQSGQAADSKAVGDEIEGVKSDLNDVEDDIVNIDATVYGRKNYVEKKKLKTDTQNKGSIVNDKRYDVTDYIDIAFVASGASIKVNYGTIPESTIFAVYNAYHEFIDSWSLSSTLNARAFTFNYASMTEPAYVRFAFQHGYDATIEVQSTGEILWEKQRGSGFDDIKNDYMSTDKYIDVSNVNRCDPSKCTSSKTINANGTISDNTSYYISDYMPIYPSETLYFFRADTGEKRNVRMFAAYDSDKNVLTALGSNEQVSSIAQSGKMAFVRCTFAYQENINYVPNATCVLANQYPDFCPAYGNYPSFNSDYFRKRINVYATDTESQIIQKFISAYNNGNCDVVFECADYTFGTELAKINTDYGMKHNEIPIGNNCRYFFNGASLTATLDLANLTPAEGDDEFYCNFFGCQRRPSSFELHDGVLSATDTRYVVHDESTAYNGSYRHLYHNMELHYHTNLRQEAIRKCLGGGTGSDGVVEIIGCKFTTDGISECASFHGNLSDVADAKFDVIMTNCWLSNGFRVNQISEHQTARVFYTGNSALIAPVIGDRCTLTAFLNEIRS